MIKVKFILFSLCLTVMGSIYSQGGGDRNRPVPFDDAKYLSQSTPGIMTPGESYGVSVTMRNTGSSTWQRGTYSLKLTNILEATAKLWGISSVDVVSSVSPGNEVVFNFTVTAPNIEDSYNLQWQMANGNAFFGEPTATIPVRVSGPTPVVEDNIINTNSFFVTQQVPNDMDEGQSYAVSVTMRNTGSTTWTPGNYKLRILTGTDNISVWTVSNVELPIEVKPGMDVTFNFNINSPNDDGLYNFQAQLTRDGAYFGQPTKNVVITVD